MRPDVALWEAVIWIEERAAHLIGASSSFAGGVP